MMYIYRIIFVLREYVLMLTISTIETNLSAKILKQGHGHHNLLKYFLTSTSDTQTMQYSN